MNFVENLALLSEVHKGKRVRKKDTMGHSAPRGIFILVVTVSVKLQSEYFKCQDI